VSASSHPIRVLIVEDSPAFRDLLVAILQSEPGFQVVGIARHGAEGLRLAKRLRPDVITMDVHMPEMDGYEATRRIMEEMPCPIVMISGSLNKNEQKLSFNALQAGALSIMEKPTLFDPPEVRRHLLAQIRLMAEVRVVRRWRKKGDKNGRSPAKAPSSSSPRLTLPPGKKDTDVNLIAIAASTGGPGALIRVLKPLPPDFPVPILVVQHVTAGFGQGLASWLNSQIPLSVRLGAHSVEPKPGEVLIAPDDYHMIVNNMGLIALSKAAPSHGLRPSANHLFHSVAEVYGRTAIGVILTGMGSDGADGLLAMSQSGARTIAQDEASCVVFGMPAVAIKLGAADYVKPLDQIAGALIKLIQE
jgi:two-component system chemotaxis response regulator CheB